MNADDIYRRLSEIVTDVQRGRRTAISIEESHGHVLIKLEWNLPPERKKAHQSQPNKLRHKAVGHQAGKLYDRLPGDPCRK